MATILYARVSTSEQTIEHQVTQAQAADFNFDQVVSDDGVSGVTTTLKERIGGRRLFDILRAGDTLVVRWVDRLGRNYQDVSDTIREFMRRGVIVRTIINGMTFDGATIEPMQQAVRDALIGFMAALSQAQAEATKEAQKAGIAHAKAGKDKVYLGRKPSYTNTQVLEIFDFGAEGKSVSNISRLTGLSRQTVYRIRRSPSDALARINYWA